MADLSSTTITIDQRIGSAYTTVGTGTSKSTVDLTQSFRQHRYGPKVRVTTLPAGDFCFPGNGPSGICMVGVERKTLKDMLSSMRTGRFSGEQLPKLMEYYDFRHLVVEGTHRTNVLNGLLEEPYSEDCTRCHKSGMIGALLCFHCGGEGRRYRNLNEPGTWHPVKLGSKTTFQALELHSFLNDLASCAPIFIHQTRDYAGTVELIMSLAYTFDKPWDRHKAHVAIHTPAPYAQIEKSSDVRRFAYGLKDVGWVLSGAIEHDFPTIESTVAVEKNGVISWVPASAFEKVKGIGKVMSRNIWKQIHGREEGK